jgi:hypothetical protein
MEAAAAAATDCFAASAGELVSRARAELWGHASGSATVAGEGRRACVAVLRKVAAVAAAAAEREQQGEEEGEEEEEEEAGGRLQALAGDKRQRDGLLTFRLMEGGRTPAAMAVEEEEEEEEENGGGMWKGPLTFKPLPAPATTAVAAAAAFAATVAPPPTGTGSAQPSPFVSPTQPSHPQLIFTAGPVSAAATSAAVVGPSAGATRGVGIGKVPPTSIWASMLGVMANDDNSTEEEM